LRELALFAGAGGGILAGHLLGWRTVCAVEWEPYAACVLAARQNDGLLPPFPIWSDVRTFDGRPWRGRVDVVSGGFPCQDISVAGKGAGIDGERSGMWGHMARIIGEVRPRFAFVENSPALLTRGLGRVLGDLAALGYDCRWTVLGAADVGAPHKRDRFWLVGADTLGSGQPWVGWGRQKRASELCEAMAHADRVRELQPGGPECQERGRLGDCGGELAYADSEPRHEGRPGDATQESGGRHAHRSGKRAALADTARIQPGRQEQWAERERARPSSESVAALCDPDRQGLAVGQGQPGHARQELAAIERADWWQSEPDVGRVADGVAHRVDRLKALGNGQVPRCTAEAWRLLTTPTVPLSP
jgi:DNA (cytosine-5)-methyltransferase 1